MDFLCNWHELIMTSRGMTEDRAEMSRLTMRVLARAKSLAAEDSRYDVGRWYSASHYDHSLCCHAGEVCKTRLIDVVYMVLHDRIGLKREAYFDLWLNRIAIEMIYGGVKNFENNRQRVIPRLLEGPVRLEFWEGQGCGLAFPLKLLVREQFGQRDMTNLLHVDEVSQNRISLIVESLEIRVTS